MFQNAWTVFTGPASGLYPSRPLVGDKTSLSPQQAPILSTSNNGRRPSTWAVPKAKPLPEARGARAEGELYGPKVIQHGVRRGLCTCRFIARPLGAHLVNTPIFQTTKKQAARATHQVSAARNSAGKHWRRATWTMALSYVLSPESIGSGVGWPLWNQWHLKAPDSPSGRCCQPCSVLIKDH